MSDLQPSDPQSGDPQPGDPQPSDPPPPTFGIVDLVDAFTALRHEYRGHVRQTREVREAIEQAAQTITQVAEAKPAGPPPPELPKLILAVIDLDIQLSRAIDAVTRSDENRQQRDHAAAADFEQSVQALSRLGRYFAADLIRSHRRHIGDRSTEVSPLADGLIILVGKVRDTLAAVGVKRIETTGQPFDGTLMRSVGIVQEAQVPAGHVAEELSPAYQDDDRVLQFANVRVAGPDA